MVVEISPFHFSTVRKNIFLWVEECERLVTTAISKRDRKESVCPLRLFPNRNVLGTIL
jgi:hypothetical protein